MEHTDKILVIDLEATCWDKPVPTGAISEIIEIGTCLLDVVTGELSHNKGILVQPQRSEVSTFCTQLTTITAELLEKEGTSFEAACRSLRPMQHFTWASYGAYDLKMMRTQCAGRNIDFPLSATHINVKELFTSLKGGNRKPGMKEALRLLNLPLEGIHHRGVDDARNIAQILLWCLQNK